MKEGQQACDLWNAGSQEDAGGAEQASSLFPRGGLTPLLLCGCESGEQKSCSVSEEVSSWGSWGQETKCSHPMWIIREYTGCAALSSVAQTCLTLGDPMDCSPPGSSVHGILQAGILEWAAMPSSRGSSQPRDRTQVSSTTGRFFTV